MLPDAASALRACGLRVREAPGGAPRWRAQVTSNPALDPRKKSGRQESCGRRSCKRMRGSDVRAFVREALDGARGAGIGCEWPVKRDATRAGTHSAVLRWPDVPPVRRSDGAVTRLVLPPFGVITEDDMSKAWNEMRISLAQYVAEIRPGRLDREQQGRLALSWASLWWVDDLRSLGEEDWRKVLCYSASEWVDVRDAFADVLDRKTCWCLRFMLEARDHQEAYSALQAERGRRSAATRGNGGSTSVEHSLNGGSTVVGQRSTSVNPAVAVAVESESKNLSAPPVPRTVRERNGKAPEPKPSPEGFEQFWTAYACPRRTGKPVALALWRSLGCEKIAEAVLAELERFKATQQWRGGFMPEPARWLKKAPWVDGPTAPTAGGDQW